MKIIFRDELEYQKAMRNLGQSDVCPGSFGLIEDSDCNDKRITQPYEMTCRKCWENALSKIVKVKRNDEDYI